MRVEFFGGPLDGRIADLAAPGPWFTPDASLADVRSWGEPDDRRPIPEHVVLHRYRDAGRGRAEYAGTLL